MVHKVKIVFRGFRLTLAFMNEYNNALTEIVARY